MKQEFRLARPAPASMGGNLTGLLRQLGSGWSLVAFEAGSEASRVNPPMSREELARRAAVYQEEVLLGHELPLIYRAFHHASRSEIRELVALDRRQDRCMPPAIAPASTRVGQAQLARLRPLIDDRVVQRYLHAVEHGQARGWHPVVLGLTLAVYSLPVFQGMIAFERQSLDGYLEAASRPLGLAEQDWRTVHDSLPLAVAQFVRVLHHEARPVVCLAES